MRAIKYTLYGHDSEIFTTSKTMLIVLEPAHAYGEGRESINTRFHTTHELYGFWEIRLIIKLMFKTKTSDNQTTFKKSYTT